MRDSGSVWVYESESVLVSACHYRSSVWDLALATVSDSECEWASAWVTVSD